MVDSRKMTNETNKTVKWVASLLGCSIVGFAIGTNAALICGCKPLQPDGFSTGVLITEIPGQGPVESKQVYGLIFTLHYDLEKGVKKMAEPRATICPNCQKPAMRTGNEITCEHCDATFVITKKQEIEVKEFGAIQDHENRILALEGKNKPPEPEPKSEPEPEEDEPI